MVHTGIVFDLKRKFRMHFVPYKVPYMNSFRNFTNRFVIENPKQNHAAEYGSDAKSGYF